MEERWNLIIYVQFGVFYFIPLGFMKFRGGSLGGKASATPVGGRGVNFLGWKRGSA